MKTVILLILASIALALVFGCADPIDLPTGLDTDTLIVYDTTIVVKIDTLIVNHYDTTIVVKRDTMIVNHFDTTFVDRVDTVYIENPPDTIYVQLPPDTVIVQLPPDTVIVQLPPDTVIQVVVQYDTTYIPISNLLYYECNPWRLEWEKWSDTIKLSNEHVVKSLLGFDRIVLGTKPNGQEPIIRINGQEVFFSVYGENSQMIWIGPMEVPAKAEIVIEFIQPYYGKVAGTLCHDFLKGSHWFIINADSVNYRP